MPTSRIHKLSPLLINQIAAGEVVTRPASVVKELIENAIDASASHIAIYIEQGGLGLIQVVDNGNGIHPDDMLLAVTRHATSKLADVGELTGIDSLGFRGEALASIAAVSHLTLTSSHDDTGIGQQLILQGSEATQADIRPVVKNRGTTVTVRDLYFNVPARRSHLKSIATEFNHIEQVVQRLAISFGDIRLELYHQNKQRFSLTAHSTTEKSQALSRLEQALGMSLSAMAHEFYLDLQSLQVEKTSPASVQGWLFVTDNDSDINCLPRLIYINQRLVTDLAISQVLQKSARQANRDDLGYALFFHLPNEWVNVNIHPSKQQVKIQPLTNILALLNQAVLEQLKLLPSPSPAQQPVAKVAKQALSDITKLNHVQTDTIDYHIYDTTTALASFPMVKTPQSIYHLQPYHQTDVNPNDYPQWLFKIHHNQLGELHIIQWQQSLYVITNNLWQDRPRFDNSAGVSNWLSQAIATITQDKLVELMLAQPLQTT